MFSLFSLLFEGAGSFLPALAKLLAAAMEFDATAADEGGTGVDSAAGVNLARRAEAEAATADADDDVDGAVTAEPDGCDDDNKVEALVSALRSTAGLGSTGLVSAAEADSALL